MNPIARRNNPASQLETVRHHLESLSGMDLPSFRNIVAPAGACESTIRRWHRQVIRQEISALKNLNLTTEEAVVICQAPPLRRSTRIPKRLAKRWGARPDELAAKISLLTPHQRQAMQYAVERFWSIWRQGAENYYVFWDDRPNIDEAIAGALLDSGLTWRDKSGSRSPMV